MQAIGVHRECKNCVVTFWVMSQFLHFLGAARGCADFRDPTAVFRLNYLWLKNDLIFQWFFLGPSGRDGFQLSCNRDYVSIWINRCIQIDTI